MSASEWASLPAELVQKACAALERQDRRSFLGVCRGWQAALAAAPHLAPPTVLRGPPLSVASLQPIDTYSYSVTYEANAIQAAIGKDARAGDNFLLRAAALHPKTWSVRLEGCEKQPSALVVAALSLLPPGVRVLELAVPCNAPVLAALGRRSQLESLSFDGSAAGIPWAAPQAAAVLPKLTSLCLDYRHTELDRYMGEEVVVTLMPPADATALAGGAHALNTLTLDTRWSDDVGRLLPALPALRSLRLSLRHCFDPAAAAAAVEALSAATGLRDLSLCISCLYNAFDDSVEQDEECGKNPAFVRVPPLAHLTALTELRLLGSTLLPPDWHLLSSLRRLHVYGFWAGTQQLGGLESDSEEDSSSQEGWLDDAPSSEEGYGSAEEDCWRRFYWMDSDRQAKGLAGLSALTSLRIDSRAPDVEAIAALPALKQLSLYYHTVRDDDAGGGFGGYAASIRENVAEFQSNLQRLRPDVTLKWLGSMLPLR